MRDLMDVEVKDRLSLFQSLLVIQRLFQMIFLHPLASRTLTVQSGVTVGILIRCHAVM